MSYFPYSVLNIFMLWIYFFLDELNFYKTKLSKTISPVKTGTEALKLRAPTRRNNKPATTYCRNKKQNQELHTQQRLQIPPINKSYTMNNLLDSGYYHEQYFFLVVFCCVSKF